MNYETITKTIVLEHEITGESYNEQRSYLFCQGGIGRHGTFVYDQCPNGEDVVFMEGYEANWAQRERFEELGAAVIDYWWFARWLKERKDEEVDEAMQYLQDMRSGPASSLRTVRLFKKWVKRYKIDLYENNQYGQRPTGE